MVKRLIFRLGGARSGKSHYAEQWAKAKGKRVLFVATAEAGDNEMAARIAEHRAKRPAGWRTLEAPRDLPRRIANCHFEHDTLLLDCITLLTSNLLLALPESITQGDAN